MATSTQHINGNGRGNAKAITQTYGKPALDAKGTREERGKEIFAMGAVKEIGNGFYRVKHHTVHLADVTCSCEDKVYNLKADQPCKHLYAAKFFLEAQRKHNGNGQGAVKPAPKNAHNTTTRRVARKAIKPLDKDGRITRLATLNTATAILQSRSRAIALEEVIEIAERLEEWAKGGQVKPSTQSAVERYAYMYE